MHKKKIEQVGGWLREALDGTGALKRYRVGLEDDTPTQ